MKRLVAILLLGVHSGVFAAIKLPPVLGDHMVLQRDTPVPVWGSAAPDEKVRVEFAGQTKQTTADAQGKWQVKLDPMPASAEPRSLSIASDRTSEPVVLTDVLVGEVWLGSGQSNMAQGGDLYVKDDAILARRIAAGPYPQIRLLTGDGKTWKEATSENLMKFSALHFSFGLALWNEIKTPVGLIASGLSGSASGPWVSQAAFQADPACRAAVAESGKCPARIGVFYEIKIRPFIPYAIRGVLWDQGEGGTDIEGVDQYTLMGALIRGWRSDWSRDLPFIYVQKPSGGGCAWDDADPVTCRADKFAPLPALVPNDGAYRETHIRIMNYPATFMATSSDLGGGIHPLNQSGYGARAARVALGAVYGKPVASYGPVYKGHTVEGRKVVVRFDHVGQGLAFRHGGKLQGFALAGKDGKFEWGDAVIVGETVEITCPKIPEPVAVRYAWAAAYPWANLFNRDGLPAMPFRTDMDRQDIQDNQMCQDRLDGERLSGFNSSY
jgi:sialate O-acetylesterase